MLDIDQCGYPHIFNPAFRMNSNNPMLKIMIIGFILFTFSGCSRDYIDYSYANTEALLQSKFTQADSWPLTLVPGNATNIYVRINLETNEYWLTFRMQPSNIRTIQDTCTPADAARITFPDKRRSSAISWWPSSLTDTSRVPAPNYRYYTCQNRPPSHLAVSNDGMKVYYWESRE